MKAIVLHQPWATLVALGIKTWETRPAPPNGPMRPDGVRGLPGLAIEPGERIAIVAGAKRPEDGFWLGNWQVESWRDAPHVPCLVRAGDTSGRAGARDLPLGAVVCTVDVAEVLPIQLGDEFNLDDETPDVVWVVIGDFPVELTRRLPDFGIADITHQLPYGDWQPGRWAWRLTGVERTEPIPVKGRQGVFELGFDPRNGAA